MQIWDKLLSPFKQVDKRQLQHEIDVHRIFLLTRYFVPTPMFLQRHYLCLLGPGGNLLGMLGAKRIAFLFT